MTSQNFIPAGFEESEDEDEYYDYYNNENYKIQQFNEKIANSLQTKSLNSDLMINQNDNKTLSPKIERKALIRSTRSPSPGSLVLDDIRLGVINGNLDYLKSQIECENNFFMDTILKAGWTSLLFAANNGHKHIVHYLLEKGSDPNFHKDNFTPLMAICSSVCPNEDDLICCAQYLINFGANVNAFDMYNNTPLIYAAKSGKFGVIVELLKKEVNVNHQNNDGWTALHWAVREGNGKIVEILINANIDISLKTSSSQTAADIALSKGHQKINDILEKLSQTTNENNGTQNRRLSEEESNSLVNYAKPKITFQREHKNKPMIRTSDIELENFLRLSNSSHLLPVFEEKDINYNELISNTEEVLEKIGVKELSVKKKILSNIILLHKQEWKRECLRDLNLETNITCPDIVSILTNVANHMSRIDETISFLRNKIDKNPEILKYDNDLSTLSNIHKETLQTLINTRSLFQNLQFFRQQLIPIEDISEPKTPDVISISYELEEEFNISEKKSKSFYSRSLWLISFGIFGVFIGIKYGNISKDNFLDVIMRSVPKIRSIPKFNSILLTM